MTRRDIVSRKARGKHKEVIMKRLVLKSAVCGLLLALVAGAAAAQSDPCEGLQAATPGLYGLCIAFHNVEPCVPDPLAEDPFAGCEPKDGRLLTAYNELKGPDDPRMPETADACPCFTASQLEASRDPAWNELACWIDCPWSGGVNWPWKPVATAIFHNDANNMTDWLGYADVWVQGNSGRKEDHACWYQAPDEPTVIISALTYSEYTACRGIVLNMIEAHEDLCVAVCAPD